MKKVIFTLFSVLLLCSSLFSQTINVIEPELQTILNQKSNDLINVNIYFKDQVNANQLKQKARRVSDKETMRNIVVTELKNLTEEIQSDVLSVLTAEELNGNVSEINCLWIANSINCKATRDVIYKLSSHPDIKALVYDKEMQLISPDVMKEISNAEAENLRATASHHILTVNADHVWEQGYTGKHVVVAVLDSGTNIEHKDIKANLWEGNVDGNLVHGWNFINNSSDISDGFGHGTHCAGIVCGDGTSGTATGVAPDAKLMTVKIVTDGGTGSPTQMLNGVQFAVANGADILSMSLGFKSTQLTTTQKEEIRRAFDNVLAADVIVCAAAGNDGNDWGAPKNVDYPAACPSPWNNPDQTLKGGLSSVVCVGANDLIGKSSQGPSTWEGTSYNDYVYNSGASMGLIRPDISAPGNLIFSLNYLISDKYKLMSGTSQSTPTVAGVMALMLEKNSTLTPAQITEIIETTAAAKPATKNNVVGAGRIDALAAINAVTEGEKTPYIKLESVTPQILVQGDNQTITVRVKNVGKGSSAAATSATLSSENDEFITIASPTVTLGQISTGNTKDTEFNINVDSQTPNGHIANFTLAITSGNYTWKYPFYVKISATPNIVFSSVTPSVIGVGQDINIDVTMLNDGTAAMDGETELTLTATSNDLNYLTIIDNSATVGSMDINGTSTGRFTIRADKETPHNTSFTLFLETYSRLNTTSDLIYEFENDNEGWTTFAAKNNVSEPWWHSTKALEHGKNAKDSHSGNGHIMSETVEKSLAEYASPIDNYVVSPTKFLVSNNTEVSFYARAHENAYYKEHFGLAVSTSGNSSASNFTMLQDWTITAQQGTSWNKYTVDLSAYAGQEIYVAIRHFFTEQEWNDPNKADNGHGVDALNIDDIMLTNIKTNIHTVPTYATGDKNMFSIYVDNMKTLTAPQNLTVTSTSTSEIALAWDAVEDAQSYNVYRDGVKIANVKTNSYTNSNLEHNTTYCYEVRAIYAGVEFDPSSELCITTKQKDYSITVKDYEPKTSKTIYVGVNESDLRLTIANDGMYKLPSRGNIVLSCDNPYVTLRSITPGTPILPDDVKPSAPIVKATATGDTSIELTWNNVLGATSYNIYHGTSTYNTTNNYYTINGLTPSTNYCFNITAVNSVGESAASEACATTLAKVVTKPSAPTNLTVVATTTATGENAFILSWNEVADATSYNVYTGTSPIASGLTETTYTVTGSGTNTLVNGTEYCYYVTAVNSGGESNASDVVCATAGAIQYRIRRASDATQYLTAINDIQHESGTYGGVAVGTLNATSKNQIFTLEDAGNDRFYLLSANNKYIKCWGWNVDAYSGTDKTALKKVEVATGDGYYIQNCDNNKYFKVEWNEDGNRNFVYGDCDGSNCTKEIWVFEPVAPTASKSAKRATTAGDPISAEISALDANVEVTSDLVVEIDPSIPNNTEIILSINVNNNNATSDIQKYNMDLSVKMIVKNDIGTPKGVTITDVKDKSLTVKWNAVANAKYYNVYRDGSFLITTPSTSIFESDLDPETTYCYTITGVNDDGESEPSMEVCATTLEEIGEVKVVSFEIGSAIGSNVSLKTRLINDSKSTTPVNTVATLTCSNPNVTIVNGTATVGALASKATKDVTFTVKIASTIPYNETIDFDVTVTYESTGETLRDLEYTFDEDFDNWSCFSWQYNGKKWFWNSEKQCLESLSYGTGFSNTRRADTHIVSPERMKLSENTKIKFDVDPTGGSYYAEKFSVYVSESAPTGVYGYESNQIHSVYDQTLSSADPQTIEISSTLSSWVGKEVYVIIRHYDCWENSLLLDNVIIQNVVSSGTVNITNTSSFTITVNPSINTYSGTGAWNLASNWSKGSVPTINEDVIINGNATIESGNITAKSITMNSGSLTVNGGATLTVTGSFLNKNTKAFIIKDGAQVFQSNDNVAATFNMYIDNPSSWGNDTKGGWQFISSPMTDVAISNFKPTSDTDYDLFKYDGTQELQWINVKNHGTDFESMFQQGRGYIVSYEAETSANFEGTLYGETDFSFKDVKAFDSEDHYNNFYLLGNPFPFNMDWSKMTISGVYNGYATISNIDGSYDYHTSGTINAGDGFMVKSTGATPVLSYAHNVRSSAEKHASLNISASNIYGSDNVIVKLAGQEDEGFSKLNNLNENIAEIYVENAGSKYGIFSFDEDVNEVKLGFKASKTGTHIIRIDADGKYEYITLVDNITGVETDMLKNEYSFTVLSTNEKRDRFTVKFGKKAEVENDNFVYQSGSELIIEGNGSVQIIDVMGRVVYNNELSGNTRVNITHLNKAAYIVRRVDGSNVNTQKIIIM